MLTLSQVKDYMLVEITETTFDTYLTAQITKVYEIVEDLLQIQIGSDDKITETFFQVSGNDVIESELFIRNITSLKDSDGNDINYTQKAKNRLMIDTNLSDENLTLVYEGFITSKLSDLALEYIGYYFNMRADQKNDLFIKSKSTANGLVESKLTIPEFNVYWENEVMSLSANYGGSVL